MLVHSAKAIRLELAFGRNIRVIWRNVVLDRNLSLSNPLEFGTQNHETEFLLQIATKPTWLLGSVS